MKTQLAVSETLLWHHKIDRKSDLDRFIPLTTICKQFRGRFYHFLDKAIIEKEEAISKFHVPR